MYTIVMRSLTYAGIISSCLGITACTFTRDWMDVSGEYISLAAWLFDYLYFRYIKKLW